MEAYFLLFLVQQRFRFRCADLHCALQKKKLKQTNKKKWVGDKRLQLRWQYGSLFEVDLSTAIKQPSTWKTTFQNHIKCIHESQSSICVTREPIVAFLSSINAIALKAQQILCFSKAKSLTSIVQRTRPSRKCEVNWFVLGVVVGLNLWIGLQKNRKGWKEGKTWQDRCSGPMSLAC